MKWYRNLKISGKLTFVFVIIIILAAALCTVLTEKMKSMRKDYNEMMEIYGNSQGYAGAIMSTFQEVKSLLAMVNLEDSQEMAMEVKTKMDEEFDPLLQESIAAYAATCKTTEETTSFEQLMPKIEAAVAMRDQVLALAIAGDFDGSKGFLLSPESDAAMGDFEKHLDSMLALNKRNADAALAASTKNISTFITVAIIAMVSVLLLVIVFLIIVSRGITNPLRQLSGMAEKLAEGCIDVQYQGEVSKDETGILVHSLENVIASIKSLVADTDMLTDAAAAGKLSVRADANKHKGEYKKIVEGINDTLDAIIAPVQLASDVLHDISLGNLNGRVEGNFRGDHAILQKAVNETVQELNSYIGQVKDVLGAIATGDLSVSINTEFRGDFSALKEAINSIALSLSNVMQNINTASEQVAAGTKQVSDGAQAVSQGATEQASAIEELTATITQIAEQVKQTASNANETNQQAIMTKQYAVEGNELMKGMQGAMEEINRASANISRIIKVIDDIAFQTNILALNAAVEAARAGVHGKGFAVVAEEVRNLAAKSAAAAKETTDLIEGSIKKAEAGTQIANETAKSLAKIVDSVETSVAVVGQIAVASSEQATGVSQINKGIEQLSQVVQANSATSEEAAAAAEELSSQAEMLKQMVSRFQTRGEQSVRNNGGMRQLAAPAHRAKASGLFSNDVDTMEYDRRMNADFEREMDRYSGIDHAEEIKIVLSDNEFGKY